MNITEKEMPEEVVVEMFDCGANALSYNAPAHEDE